MTQTGWIHLAILLLVFAGKPFTLADLPPLPPDVVSWSMTNFDTGAFYDTRSEEHTSELQSLV